MAFGLAQLTQVRSSDDAQGMFQAAFSFAGALGAPRGFGFARALRQGAAVSADIGQIYSGVREASEFLRANGVGRAQRVAILQSFETQTIRLRAAGASEFGLRYFDNIKAFSRGRYLFETFPASRDALALQSRWNQMLGFTQFQLRPGAMLIEGRTAPQGAWAGGAMQKFVLNPRMDLIECK
jgi:hypothetical protein